jgi:hypothetical protein
MDTSNLTHTIVAIIYYILIIPMAIFSAFGIYIFIRYGKSSLFALIASCLYIAVFLGLLASSYHLLQSI